MGWDTGEEIKINKEKDVSFKILMGIIACVIFIALLAILLLIHINQTTYIIKVDGKEITSEKKDALLKIIDNETYINIEEFAKLVKYAYHKGEYKTFTNDEDKCYVQGNEETASFYLNDNKICKLPVGKVTDNYQEFSVKQTIKKENGKMYASKEAIELAFNTILSEDKKSFSIYTLDYLVNIYDKKAKSWGYTGITNQNFENKKAVRYGYLIVKKENGLYKIINDKNDNEIVPDRYNSIQFAENTKEFFVKNSLEQVGIINLNGTTKIEPIYDDISILDKKAGLYLIKKNELYGIIKSGNVIILRPEYDKIGIDTANIAYTVDSQYELLNTLIPVCKKGKWGLFNKSGQEVIKIEYDDIGCPLTTIKVKEEQKKVLPLVEIKECNGIVVKKDDKYGLINMIGKKLVPIAVDGIYAIKNEITDEVTYYMLYKNEELNVLERLRLAGLIEDPNAIKEENKVNNETTTANMVESNVTNQLSNTMKIENVQTPDTNITNTGL